MIDTLPNLTMPLTNNRVTCVLEILHTTHLTKVFSFSLCANSHGLMLFHCTSAAKKACLQRKNKIETCTTVTKEHFRRLKTFHRLCISAMSDRCCKERKFFQNNLRLFYNLKTLQLSCVQQGLLTYMYDNFANTFAYRIQFHLWFLFCYGLFYYLFQDFTVELCQISFATYMYVGFQLCYRSFYNLFKD